jgi:Flp pilus assembly protein TadG
MTTTPLTEAGAPATEPTEPGRRRPPRHSSDEGGFAMIYFALTLIVFMAMAGLGLDLWNIWRTSQEVQRAADAGALAGVTFLPGDVPLARNTAFDLIEANGFPRADATVQQGDTPQKLEVSVNTTVDNTFMGLLGVATTDITRQATAEFVGPVPMGSPANFLGNDPDLNDIVDHWMNVGSVRNQAGNGDRYHNGLCPGSGALGPCTAGIITNPSYSPNGHFYAVEVAPGTTGTLRVEIFDPAFYEVGDRCTENQAEIFGGVNQGTLQATAVANPNIPNSWHDDAADRYVGGNSPRWCTGDWLAGATRGGNGPITTTYIVREPDSTSFIDTDNPVVSTATCGPKQFTGRDVTWMRNGGAGIQGRLNAGAESQVLPLDTQTLANTFRRWVTVCEIPNPTAGRYILQVRTNAPLGQPTTDGSTTVNTYGHNRYAIRAGIGTDPTAASYRENVKVFANGRLPIYANADGANTEFFLARVLPSGADRILQVSLWDLSDGGSGGSMRVLPPSDSPTANFSGCTFSATPAGGYTPNTGTCSFSFGAGALNEKVMQVSVPIPSTYTCDESDPFGCWIKVQAPFDGQVNDTTTWSADVVGDPVRLIE